MDLFDQIDKEKEELPKLRHLTQEMQKQKLNGYQIIAVVTFIVLFIVGIILGNLFPACEASSLFGACTKRQFNLSLTIFFWFASFLVCVFYYALGHLIFLLSSINEKLTKRK